MIDKYRAWDLDNLRMFYSDKDEDSGEGTIVWEYNSKDGLYFLEPTPDSINGYSYHKPNQISEKWTGLSDKNKKKIYDGDIIQFCCVSPMEVIYDMKDPEPMKKIVWWDQENCKWGLKQLDGKPQGSGYSFVKRNEPIMEVIGNVHETELKCRIYQNQ